MAKREVSAKEKIFQIVNLLVLIAISGCYLYRLVHYQRILNPDAADAQKERTLADAVNELMIQNTDSLVREDDGSWYFVGNMEENYLEADGWTFRILGEDADGLVRCVSAQSAGWQTYSAGMEFSQTAVFRWLNETDAAHSGVFEHSLAGTASRLAESSYCASSVDDVLHPTCELSEEKAKVQLLSLADYVRAGGSESFLMNGEAFWLLTESSEGSVYFVQADGAVSASQSQAEAYGVRPVILLEPGIMVYEGSGAEDSPLRLDKAGASSVSEMKMTEYVSYSGQLWRVIGKNEDGSAVAMMEGTWKDAEGKDVLLSYGEDNVYSDSEGIGGYLNGTFFSSLESGEELLQKQDFWCGSLSALDGFPYDGAYEDAVSAYVGLPGLQDFLIGGTPGMYLMNRGSADSVSLMIAEQGNPYEVHCGTEAKVRPLICLKAQDSISGGTGTKADPYRIGAAQENADEAEGQ